MVLAPLVAGLFKWRQFEPEMMGVLKDLERIKWYLWHGNVFQALNELQSLEMDLDAAAFESKNENSRESPALQICLPLSKYGRVQ